MPGKPADAAVTADVTIFETEHCSAFCDAGKCCQGRHAVVGVYEIQDRGRKQLRGVVTQGLDKSGVDQFRKMLDSLVRQKLRTWPQHPPGLADVGNPAPHIVLAVTLSSQAPMPTISTATSDCISAETNDSAMPCNCRAAAREPAGGRGSR